MEGLLEPLLFSVFFALPVIVGLVCLYYAFRYLYQIRLIQDTPTSKIRSAAQGYVELSGTAQPLGNEVLISTITKTSCLWYRYLIEEWRTLQTSDGPKAAYQFLDQQESDDFFILQDNTGECIINPKGAEIIPCHTTIVYGDTPIPKQAYPWSIWFYLLGNTPRYRYREYRIDLNEELRINGSFETIHKEEFDLQQNATLNAFLTEKNLQSCHVVSSHNLPPEHIFLLSAIPQQELIKQCRWKAFFFFLTFLFLCIVSTQSIYPMVHQALSHWYQTDGYKYFPRYQWNLL